MYILRSDSTKLRNKREKTLLPCTELSVQDRGRREAEMTQEKIKP
jgi:hypothetical protein